MTSPYREPGVIIPFKGSTPKLVCGGYLFQYVEPIKPHKCNTPGILACLWYRIKVGQEWGCQCGQIWRVRTFIHMDPMWEPSRYHK